MNTAQSAARTARRSTAFRRTARAGYVVLGVVHVILGVMAVSIATGSGGDADQDGVMEQLRASPVGGLLLWAAAIGLVALAVWVIAGAFVATDSRATRKWAARLRLAGIAIAYLVLAAMASIYAVGGRAESEETSRTFSEVVLAAPGGVGLLVLAGLGVVAVGIGFVVAGFARSFEKTIDLPDGAAGRGVVTFGVIGFIAKGIAVALTGGLFVVAALTQDPEKAAGMDAALHGILALPLGRLLLWVIGAGLVVYGIFCFLRARLAQM